MYSVVHPLSPTPECCEDFEDLLKETAAMFAGLYNDVETVHG